MGSHMSYLELLADKQVQQYYNFIQKTANNCPIDHSLEHIMRTVENAKILADIFQIKNADLQNLLSACTLHDIGYVHSRKSHAMFGAIKCRSILRQHNYSAENIEIISSIIASHNSFNANCYDFDISIIAMLADKLDLCEYRYNEQFIGAENTFKSLLSIEYISFKKNDKSVDFYINCKPFASIKLLKNCPLIYKLGDYLDLASDYLQTQINLNFNIRKALTKI